MKRIISVCTAVLITLSVLAQAPNRMSYQAVIRNTSNVLVTNSVVGMRISILQSTSIGTAVYVETQTPSTNANGLVSIEIGGGNVVQGNFSTIDWANDQYFIKTETDPAGGSNYSITSTSQLLSVPYALYSRSTGDTTTWRKKGNDIYYNNGKVGIKVQTPKMPLEVNGNILLTNRDHKLIFGDGTNVIDSVSRIYRPIWSDGLMMEGNDISIKSKGVAIELISNSGVRFNNLSGSTKMYFNTSNGNLGIGNTSPQRTLHVSSVMRLEPIATAPSSPAKGDMYFDSTLNKLRVYDGTAWQNCW